MQLHAIASSNYIIRRQVEMRKMGIMVIVALIFSLVVGTILGGCESADTTKLKVVMMAF